MSVWFEDAQNAALEELKKHQKSYHKCGFVKVMPYGQVSTFCFWIINYKNKDLIKI